MKLFQKLLVAPAAIGLIAPVAANAAELSIKDVSDYSSSRATRSTRVASAKRVKGLSQFSDVYPTDWAYQALASMLERHGCAPVSTKGAITRYEAAAVLNNCLGNVAQANDEERRLINEFAPELSVVKGRLDGIEAGIGVVDSGEFSTTTVLEGRTIFTLNGNKFIGVKGDKGRDALSSTDANNDANEAQANFGASTFSYDILLSLTTSFNGEDSLVSHIRAGNFNDLLSFGSSAPHNVSGLEYGYNSSGEFRSDRLYYQRPFGDFTFTAGPNVRQDDMLAVWPSAYHSDSSTTMLDLMTLAGAPGAYHLNKGAGAGLSWDAGNGVSVSANYVAADGSGVNASDGGLFTDGSSGTTTVQLGYQRDRWGIAGVWSYLQDSTDIYMSTNFVQNKLGGTTDDGTNAYGISAYWVPENTGWIPSISAGYGVNSTDTETNDYVEESNSWMVGLEWGDFLGEGNALGLALGSAVTATEVRGTANIDDDNIAIEAWYKYRVSDNIVVSPGLYFLDSPLGDNDVSGQSKNFQQLGGVLRTTFTF